MLGHSFIEENASITYLSMAKSAFSPFRHTEGHPKLWDVGELSHINDFVLFFVGFCLGHSKTLTVFRLW